MTIERWVEAATADATRRGLPELRPLLENLARATAALRAADWNTTVQKRVVSSGRRDA